VKTILHIVLTVGIMLTGIAPVYAADEIPMVVPAGVISENRDGRQLVIKLYSLPASEDPGVLIEEPFERDGFLYAFESITKEEKPYAESKTHSETVTVETATGDLAVVLGALAPAMPYDDGTYSGALALDHTSIKTDAAGYTTKNYTVSETKTIEGLDRNDPGYVPKSTIKNGRTLMLSNVEWSVSGTGLADSALIPSTYTAVATYTAGASAKYATGYVTTATYSGEVVSEGIDSISYTVTYAGKPTIGVLNGNNLFLIIAVSALLLVASAITFVLLRRNTRIYAPEAGGSEYELMGKCRLRSRNPIIDLCRLRKYPRSEAYVEIDGRTARRLFGRIVRISLRDGVRTHLIEQTGNENYWFTVSTATEREESI
jgi:hypothetical protein